MIIYDTQTIPYTYLLGWTSHNKWYYGVRYAKGCSPNDLWKTYFTSSKYVKKFRKLYGEPDIIDVRKIFPNNETGALLWETKVLLRMNVINDPKWLNATNNKAISNSVKRNYKPGLEAIKIKRAGKTFDEYHSQETAQKIREYTSKKFKTLWKDETFRKKASKKPQDTTNYKKAATERWNNSETRYNLKESMRKPKLNKPNPIPCNNCERSISPSNYERHLKVCLINIHRHLRKDLLY